MHPAPGQIWVVDKVRAAIEEAGLCGLGLAEVETNEKCGVALIELVVHGRGWRSGTTEASLQACALCRRRVFPDPDWMAIDEDRWDGSDFFLVDYNPNIVIVTERVATLLGEGRFSNLTALDLA